MIIHCDSCGKAVSNRLEKCPFCQFAARPKKDQQSFYRTRFDELVPTFHRKVIG